MRKITKYLGSPMLMAMLIIAFAVSCALATFIENDFGTQAARAVIYNAWWFEVIMLLLAINFLISIITRKLFMKGKRAIMLFHLGFVVILLGAGITRYNGQEGMMHIREGETVSWFSSSEKWISIYHNAGLISDKEVLLTPVSKNKYSQTETVNGQKLQVKLTHFIPRAIEVVEPHQQGYPVVELMYGQGNHAHQLLIYPNSPANIGNIKIGLASDGADYPLQLVVSEDSVTLYSQNAIPTINHRSGTAQQETFEEGMVTLQREVIYGPYNVQFHFRNYWNSARVKMVHNPNNTTQGTDAIALRVNYNGQNQTVFVPLTDIQQSPVYATIGGEQFGFKFGSKQISLPFGLELSQFVLERYPGSDSPSSFTSHVIVKDGAKAEPFSIFMNNILSHKGYRFYQSSYDNDEKGTILSVNKDLLGTNVSYTGYAILVIGIIGSLFSKGSRFRKLIAKPNTSLLVALLIIGGLSLKAQSNNPTVSKQHAREFGSLLIQDKGGRIKPISTLSGEVLRKLNRSNSFEGQTAEQVYLGMSVFPDYWQHVPIIKVKNKELINFLGAEGQMVAFVDFFNHGVDGSYKLREIVQEAFALKPAQRSAMQKEIIKADEKVNVLYMVFSGQMAKIFPIPEHEDNLWLSMDEATRSTDSIYMHKFSDIYAQYALSVRNNPSESGWKSSTVLLQQLKNIQQEFAHGIVPSTAKVKAETLSNRLLIFERLIPIYGLTGLVLLIIVFAQFINRKLSAKRISILLTAVLIFGFAAQTFGIGLRWYIAGRAPLSNGFESMVYVAWAAMLAGFMFARRSKVVLPATALLSTLVLFVAHLSWMDPEITNLVPVLKSYWLTIHVAVITASYGFFGLGAILGLFNILLYAFQNKKNAKEIDEQIEGITIINELTMTLGLYLLTIGSFLGAVWANESWGRYWAWDPKETWALITMLVYTFVLHMRLIPSFKSSFAMNLGSLIGIGSVLMTYFGVNYYLSGLHSYAGGDSLSMPRWIVLIVVGIFVTSFYAWYNNKKMSAPAKGKKQ